MIGLATLLIIPLSFLAFLLKSVATFGPGVVLVPLGALLIGAREIVTVIAALDLISNASLLQKSESTGNKFWLPLVLAMVIGSAAGAVLLVLVPAHYFDLILGALLLPLGAWLVIRPGKVGNNLQDTVPPAVERPDLAMAALAGCTGGLAGITGPILAWHLGRRFAKDTFRRIMIPVLFASALVRVVAYAAAGLFNTSILLLVLLAVPGLALGLWLGNRLFARVPQYWFTAIIGALIVVSGVKLLIR